MTPVGARTTVQSLDEMRILAADGLGGLGSTGSTETNRSCQVLTEIQPELKIGRAHRSQPFVLENDCLRCFVVDFSNPRVSKRGREFPLFIEKRVWFQREPFANQPLVCLLRRVERRGRRRTAICRVDTRLFYR